MCRLSKIASKYNRDLTNEIFQKCKGDTLVSDGTDCTSKLLDWLVTLKRKPGKVKNKIVEHELQLIPNSGSWFDTSVVLNGLSNSHRMVTIVKN